MKARAKGRGDEATTWPAKPRAADWVKWARVQSVPLEVATALSLGLEPEGQQLIRNPPEEGGIPLPVGRTVTVQGGRPHRRLIVQWHFPWTTAQGHDRLMRLREHHGTPSLPAAESPTGQQLVRLQDLARFAALQGWDVPQPLATMLPGEQPHEGVRCAPAAALGGAQPPDAPVKCPPQPAESPLDRQARRFDRLLELGGRREWIDGGWQAGGKHGALARLAREERDAGRPMSGDKEVRLDVDAEASRRRSAGALLQS